MILLPAVPMARKKSSQAPSDDQAEEPDALRNVALYKDVAKWLTHIARYVQATLKEEKKIFGHDKIRSARIIDPIIRQSVWEAYVLISRIERGDQLGADIPPVAPRPDELLDLRTPGLDEEIKRVLDGVKPGKNQRRGSGGG